MANSRLASNAARAEQRGADAGVATSRLQLASAIAAANDELGTTVADITGGSAHSISDLDAEIAALGASGTAASLDFDTDVALAANSDARLPTQKAVKTFVTAAVAALVNASPAALDTLKELADALGDDANFAATVTTSLAGKQPIDADLTAIAALATTPFGRALLTLGTAAALTAALGFTALVKTAAYVEAAVSGEIIAWCNLAGGFAITLPAAAGNAAKLTYKNLRADGPVTIAAAGSDTIDGNAALLLSAQYASVTLVSDGISAWGII